MRAGRIAEAITLFERAVELCSAVDDPGRLSDARFALARALLATSPRRAVELARLARVGYERERAYRATDLAEVDAWLARR